MSRDSEVRTGIRFWARKHRNLCSIADRGKRFILIFPAECSWFGATLLARKAIYNGYQKLFPWGIRLPGVKMTSDSHLAPNLRKTGATHPLLHAHAWYPHRQIYFTCTKI